MAKDKGQHLRVVFPDGTGTITNFFVALGTSLSVHFSATTEDSTTKDDGDVNGNWNKYDVTQRSGDIQIGALIGVGTDTTGKSLNDWINAVSDSIIPWKLVTVTGSDDRTIVKTVCSGNGKLTNVQPNGQNLQKATYSCTLNMYGPVTVGTD
jgi:hypothetical protein